MLFTCTLLPGLRYSARSCMLSCSHLHFTCSFCMHLLQAVFAQISWRQASSQRPAKLHLQVGEAAGRVHIEPFVPRQGVQIETDPKATSADSATAMGDDEGAIEALIQRLQVGTPRCAALLGACCSSNVVCLWRPCSVGWPSH